MNNNLFKNIHLADEHTLQNIHNWINGALSKSHIQFGNLSACPYAREALIKNEVLILSTQEDIPNAVQTLLEKFDSYSKRIIVLSCPSDSLSVNETKNLVSEYRKSFSQKNLWLMYDHPQIEESVDNVDFSYGKSLLFFFQKLDDISNSAEKLLDKGYYQNWPKNYFEKVYSEREQLNKKNKN